ncbi:GNAT family N-acetyltransferase [Gordonia sinesedis]
MAIPASEVRIERAGPDGAGIAARLQVDFDTEFDVAPPPAAVLEARYRGLLADPAAFVLFAWDEDARVGSASGDRPVGYALVTLRPTIYCDGPLAVLDELYVVPDRRDGGIGTRLLSGAVDEVRARGGGEMHINVDEIDTDTRRFYERHGFVNIEPGTDYRMLCYVRELE